MISVEAEHMKPSFGPKPTLQSSNIDLTFDLMDALSDERSPTGPTPSSVEIPSESTSKDEVIIVNSVQNEISEAEEDDFEVSLAALERVCDSKLVDFFRLRLSLSTLRATSSHRY